MEIATRNYQILLVILILGNIILGAGLVFLLANTFYLQSIVNKIGDYKSYQKAMLAMQGELEKTRKSLELVKKELENKTNMTENLTAELAQVKRESARSVSKSKNLEKELKSFVNETKMALEILAYIRDWSTVDGNFSSLITYVINKKNLTELEGYAHEVWTLPEYGNECTSHFIYLRERWPIVYNLTNNSFNWSVPINLTTNITNITSNSGEIHLVPNLEATPDINKHWVYDANGNPITQIVVGSNAGIMDGVAAANLAAAIGSNTTQSITLGNASAFTPITPAIVCFGGKSNRCGLALLKEKPKFPTDIIGAKVIGFYGKTYLGKVGCSDKTGLNNGPCTEENYPSCISLIITNNKAWIYSGNSTYGKSFFLEQAKQRLQKSISKAENTLKIWK